jgi:hypothetical protein
MHSFDIHASIHVMMINWVHAHHNSAMPFAVFFCNHRDRDVALWLGDAQQVDLSHSVRPAGGVSSPAARLVGADQLGTAECVWMWREWSFA